MLLAGDTRGKGICQAERALRLHLWSRRLNRSLRLVLVLVLLLLVPEVMAAAVTATPFATAGADIVPVMETFAKVAVSIAVDLEQTTSPM